MLPNKITSSSSSSDISPPPPEAPVTVAAEVCDSRHIRQLLSQPTPSNTGAVDRDDAAPSTTPSSVQAASSIIPNTFLLHLLTSEAQQNRYDNARAASSATPSAATHHTTESSAKLTTTVFTSAKAASQTPTLAQASNAFPGFQGMQQSRISAPINSYGATATVPGLSQTSTLGHVPVPPGFHSAPPSFQDIQPSSNAPNIIYGANPTIPTRPVVHQGNVFSSQLFGLPQFSNGQFIVNGVQPSLMPFTSSAPPFNYPVQATSIFEEEKKYQQRLGQAQYAFQQQRAAQNSFEPPRILRLPTVLASPHIPSGVNAVRHTGAPPNSTCSLASSSAPASPLTVPKDTLNKISDLRAHWDAQGRRDLSPIQKKRRMEETRGQEVMEQPQKTDTETPEANRSLPKSMFVERMRLLQMMEALQQFSPPQPQDQEAQLQAQEEEESLQEVQSTSRESLQSLQSRTMHNNLPNTGAIKNDASVHIMAAKGKRPHSDERPTPPQEERGTAEQLEQSLRKKYAMLCALIREISLESIEKEAVSILCYGTAVLRTPVDQRERLLQTLALDVADRARRDREEELAREQLEDAMQQTAQSTPEGEEPTEEDDVDVITVDEEENSEKSCDVLLIDPPEDQPTSSRASSSNSAQQVPPSPTAVNAKKAIEEKNKTHDQICKEQKP